MFYIGIFFIIRALWIVYMFLRKKHSYWKDRDVPGPRPMLVIGSFLSFIDKRRHNLEEMSKLYKDFKGTTSAVGIYYGLKPALVVIDPDLARQVMITNFSHFTDTVGNFSIDKEVDPLIGLNPFFLKGDEWKEKRGEISPVFTNGRIKSLFPAMQEAAQALIQYLHKTTKDHVEMREVCAKFTTNVVASSVFGVDGGAFNDDTSHIRNISKNVLKPSIRLVYVLFFAPFFPNLAKLLKVKLCQEREETLLKQMFSSAVDARKQSTFGRHDMLDFLMQLREKKQLSEVQIAAHTLSFFLDGVETSSLSLANIFYELARDGRCQEKLRAEMVKIQNDEGLFEYETLKENKYLEQVIYESLRLHPIMHVHLRECTKEKEFEISKDKKLKVEKGTSVAIPVYDIQRDPEYFGTDADQFNPERFNEENGGIKRYTTDEGVLFPFGDGPRVCLGREFAKIQLKCCVAHLVTSFRFSVSSEMPQNATYDPLDFLLSYKCGVLLDLILIK